MGKNSTKARDGVPPATTAELTAHRDILRRLARTIAQRRGADPATSYVATLFAKGDEAMVKKIGEEAIEAVIAAMDGDQILLTAVIADLRVHCLAVLVEDRLGPEDVVAELQRRASTSV